MRYYYCYESPIGPITLGADCNAVTELLFEMPPADRPQQKTPLLQQTIAELDEYFSGKRKQFTIPLAPQGTVFQKRVWDALLTIPYGQTRTYGQIAAQISKPKACRAVGMANHNNPISILIPCHRVIGANGSLTGYGGGLPVKQTLLALEKGTL